MSPFQSGRTLFFLSEFTPFSAGAYYALSLGIIFVEFITIKETDFCSEQSFPAFVSLLLVQIGCFFIVSGISWLLVFFGYIVVFASINYFIRTLYRTNKDNVEKLVSPYFILNALSIIVLFIGIICYHIVENTYHIHIIDDTAKIWEFLSLTFIIFFLYIQLGCPPFHFWIFSHSDQKKNSSSQILIVVQRSLAILFFFRILKIFVNSDYSIVLFWIFIISGIIYTFWGILAAMTEEKLQKLVSYISLSHTGFIFVLASLVMFPNINSEISSAINHSLCYLVLSFVLLYSFIFAITSTISKGYGTSNLNDLRGLGRRTYFLPFLLSLGFFLFFALPIGIGIQANLFSYNTMPSSLYFVMILFDFQVLLSTIFLVRIVYILYMEKRVPTIRFTSVEPSIYLGLLFSIFLIIIFLIFSTRILEFCLYMAESLS
jgi:NADH-quinone oxidoreductase subunit N